MPASVVSHRQEAIEVPVLSLDVVDVVIVVAAAAAVDVVGDRCGRFLPFPSFNFDLFLLSFSTENLFWDGGA